MTAETAKKPGLETLRAAITRHEPYSAMDSRDLHAGTVHS